MRRWSHLAAGIVLVATLASAATSLPRLLVWNVTASVPTGFYYLGTAKDIERGTRVAIDPPPGLRQLLAARGYLPMGIPLLKTVAALPGDTVCRANLSITINGRFAGFARAADRIGRPLPVWQGCRILAAGEFFALNRRAADSFDGRYFGPLLQDRIIGRAVPVWTDEAGNGAHSWFAQGQPTPAPVTTQGDTR